MRKISSEWALCCYWRSFLDDSQKLLIVDAAVRVFIAFVDDAQYHIIIHRFAQFISNLRQTADSYGISIWVLDIVKPLSYFILRIGVILQLLSIYKSCCHDPEKILEFDDSLATAIDAWNNLHKLVFSWLKAESLHCKLQLWWLEEA